MEAKEGFALSLGCPDGPADVLEGAAEEEGVAAGAVAVATVSPAFLSFFFFFFLPVVSLVDAAAAAAAEARAASPENMNHY
jgi:hypothetical protein